MTRWPRFQHQVGIIALGAYLWQKGGPHPIETVELHDLPEHPGWSEPMPTERLGRYVLSFFVGGFPNSQGWNKVATKLKDVLPVGWLELQQSCSFNRQVTCQVAFWLGSYSLYGGTPNSAASSSFTQGQASQAAWEKRATSYPKSLALGCRCWS